MIQLVENYNNPLGLEKSRFQLGSVPFEVIQGVSNSSNWDEESKKIEPQTVRVVAWFLDDAQFGNVHLWNAQRGKEEKLKAFVDLYESKKIHLLEYRPLNVAGFKFGKITRREIAYHPRAGYIEVSFDLLQYSSQQEKEEKRNPPGFKEAGAGETGAEGTPKEAEAFENIGQAEESEANAFLKNIDDGLGKLFSYLKEVR